MYLKEGFEDAIKGVRRLIFDFDGVLVQTYGSFRMNIIKVVDYYFLKILGLKGAAGKLITLMDAQAFKDTGLFNNDWNLAYAAIMYYLSILFRRLKDVGGFKRVRDEISGLNFGGLRDFLIALQSLGGEIGGFGIDIDDLNSEKERGDFSMKSFLESCQLGDPDSVRYTLSRFFPESRKENVSLASRMIPYSSEEDDLLRRLFEESYLGCRLFKLFYGREPYFDFQEGFMEKEEFIPTSNTLDLLAGKFGKFGIYSERTRAQALYHLERNGATRYFNEEWLIFLDEIAERERAMGMESGEKIVLGKPDPTVFIELIEECADGAPAAYVGDSVSDLLMVERARGRGLKDIYFFGVLSSSHDREALSEKYRGLGAEIIVEDINELASLLEGL